MDDWEARFRIDAPVSDGEYFTSHRATELSSGRTVFLKRARPARRYEATVVAEAHLRLWQDLARTPVDGMPRVAAVFGGDRPVLVTEWIDGTDLIGADPSFVARFGPRFPETVLRAVLATLAAFQRRHGAHRDIAPGNILVGTPRGWDADPIWLIDPAPAIDLPDRARPGHRLILTTERWLPPEVADGDPWDMRSDLHALGRVIADVALRSGLPVPRLVDALTARDPQDRPLDAARALELLEGSPVAPGAGMSSWGSPAPAARPAANPFDAPAVPSGWGSPAPESVQDVWGSPVPLPPPPPSSPPPAPASSARPGSGGGLFARIARAFSAPSSDPAPPPPELEIPAFLRRNADRGDTTRLTSVPAASRSPELQRHEVSRLTSVPIAPTVAGTPVAADFVVTAPPEVRPNSHFVIELWVSASHDHDAMLGEALRGGRMMTRGGRARLSIDADQLITATLRLPGFTIDEPVETLAWNGDIRNTAFLVGAPATLAPGTHPGIVRLMQNNAPFASIHFDVVVAAADRPADPAPTPLPQRVRRIERAFASYASRDRAAVLQRAQGIRVAGTELFLDVLDIRAGDDWAATLHREIEQRDALFLFWSRNAAASEWVEKEWRYALDKQGIDFISPVPLEDPRLATPPPELASRHFNDMLLAYIQIEELALAQRPPPTG